jgi:hypothetical protein
MCTATTSPGTISTLNYWAREFPALTPTYSPLTFIFIVYSIFFLETVQTVLSGADLYYWFAAGFGNVDQLTTPFASFVDVPIMGSVVSLAVQFCFVYRIFMLSETRPWLLCAVICLVTLSPKSEIDLIILPVALNCQRIRSVCSRHLCEFPQFLMTRNMSYSQQSYIVNGFIRGNGLKVFEMVKPLNRQDGLFL